MASGVSRAAQPPAQSTGRHLHHPRKKPLTPPAEALPKGLLLPFGPPPGRVRRADTVAPLLRLPRGATPPPPPRTLKTQILSAAAPALPGPDAPSASSPTHTLRLQLLPQALPASAPTTVGPSQSAPFSEARGRRHRRNHRAALQVERPGEGGPSGSRLREEASPKPLWSRLPLRRADPPPCGAPAPRPDAGGDGSTPG